VTRKLKISRELKINVFLLFSVLIVFFVMFELLIRIFWIEPGSGDWQVELYIPDSELGYKLRSSFVGNYLSKRYKDVEIKINSKGLRDKEYTYEGSPDTLRILSIGDSIAYGEGLNIKYNFAKILENKLNSEGNKAEVINFGVSGYQFDQIYNYFMKEGVKYSPDIVIYNVALNDVLPVDIKKLYKQFDSQSIFSSKGSFKFFLDRYCKSCKFTHLSLKNIYFSLNKNAEKYNKIYFNKVYDSWQTENYLEFENKLIRLSKYIDSNDIKLLVVVYPYKQQLIEKYLGERIPQDKLKHLTDSYNIAYLDLTYYFENLEYEKYYLPFDDAHFNI
jgi:hypothetical protein